MGQAGVEDDGETRGPVDDHDGEKRYELSLVLFSHSVSEPQLIPCIFAHNLFQTALQVCAQDSLRLDRTRECRLDSARFGSLLLSFTEFNSEPRPSTCSLLQTTPMKHLLTKFERQGRKSPQPPQQTDSSGRPADTAAGPPVSQTGLDVFFNGR